MTLLDNRPEPGVFLQEPPEVRDSLGLVAVEIGEVAVYIDVLIGVGLGGVVRDGVAAPHTAILVAGRLSVTPRTDERGKVLTAGLVVGDLQAHESSVLVADVLVEQRDVAGDGVGAGDSPLSALDIAGVHPLFREPRQVALPEVRRRDGLVDPRPLGRPLEHIEIGLIGEPVGRGELRPQVIVGPARVFGEPPIHVRRRRDEIHRPLAGLAVDRDGQPVFGVAEIRSLQVVQLPATQAGVELEGDRRGIAAVPTVVEHRFDILFPDEHIALVRRRIIRVRQRRGDPVDRGGRAVGAIDALVGDTSPIHPQCNAIVLVRLRRLVEVVLAVNPADDGLGRFAVGECVGQLDACFLGDPSAMPQQLHMSMIPIGLSQQRQCVRKLKQYRSVPIRPAALASFELPAECVDLVARCGHTDGFIHWLLKVWLKSLPWLPSFCLHANGKAAPVSESEPLSQSNSKAYATIATANGGVAV